MCKDFGFDKVKYYDEDTFLMSRRINEELKETFFSKPVTCCNFHFAINESKNMGYSICQDENVDVVEVTEYSAEIIILPCHLDFDLDN